MCGFAGHLGSLLLDGLSGEQEILRRMADAIAHRGPDDAGYWFDLEHQIGLAHRRLSIVDLSPAGHQPMHSASGRFVLILNGEIYNHQDLRKKLNALRGGQAWRGHSDTEVLLAGIEAWGVREALELAVGMFAFALWDRDSHTLTLGRDRLGEKPLYYGWQGRVFLFGSQLSALRAHPAFIGQIERGALSLLLRYNTIPSPYSIYQGIFKLPPGTLLTVSLHQPDPAINSYWSGASVARNGVANPFSGTAEQAVDELEFLLMDSIRQQMMADVPLGAFLSGGVDSSTVAALMQAQSSRQVKTFTIGFDTPGYNEAEHAKAVAKHLGTDHSEHYVTSKEALDMVALLPAIYDEPFADASQIPTLLVSRLARQHVTVALSGDAGDELFCGYRRYLLAEKLWRRIFPLPIPIRELLAQAITVIPPGSWNQIAMMMNLALPPSKRLENVGDKLHKAAGILASQSTDDLYFGLISHWRNPESTVKNGTEPPTLISGKTPDLSGLSDVQRMMALDMLHYLPDDVLTKVDRASMGVSLETRAPFLDHRIVEFAWRLPQSMKVNEGRSKWILRQVLYRHVPEALIERPKMGFGVPLDAWLRGALREWAEGLLDETRLRREGFFHATSIRKMWAEHLSGRRNWSYHLWNVLMFQSWLEHQPQGVSAGDRTISEFRMTGMDTK